MNEEWELEKSIKKVSDAKIITKAKTRDIRDKNNNLVKREVSHQDKYYVFTGVTQDGQLVEFTLKNPEKESRRILHGWIDDGCGDYYCSECGYESDRMSISCPECGEQLIDSSSYLFGIITK